MPFQIYSGYLIVVEGRIGTWKGLKFVLDTGTTQSILSKKMADKLSLYRQPARVLTFNETVPIESCTVSDVEFGPVQAIEIQMSIMDLGKLSEYGGHIDALVGLDLLQLNNLTFDYGTRKVLFGPLDGSLYHAPKGSKPLCFSVNVNVQGHLIRLIVDTGLEGILLYEDRVRAQVPKLRMEAGTKKVIIGQRMSGKLATLPEMRLGKAVMVGRVLLIEAAPANMIDGIAGCIGIYAFHATRITFNTSPQTITWE
jgi:hypothetical protein